MRDLAIREPRKLAAASFDIDLSFIDEGRLDQEKVQQLFERVDIPTDKVISPTISSGKNTRLLISLCKKLHQIAQEKERECRLNLAYTTADFGNLHEVELDASATTAHSDLQKFIVVLATELTKIQIFRKHGNMIEAQDNTIQLLLRLLVSLLKRQEDHGPAITKDPKNIEYLALAYALIDREWANLRKVYVLMQKEVPRIENIRKWRGHLEVAGGSVVQLQVIYKFRQELGLTV